MTVAALYAVVLTLAANRWHVRKCRDQWAEQSARVICAKPYPATSIAELVAAL
jgi:hypothetical protein